MRTHKKKEKMQEECPSATSGIECTSIQIQNRVTTDQCNLVLLSQRKLCFKKKTHLVCISGATGTLFQNIKLLINLIIRGGGGFHP
jgi:hypothetical protein